ncbi:MAG: hypothetical protein MUF56_09735, partial [Solirubrobacteraceae bacterium]|nr:hypothetical protein [Solirubrobacteraceae bacterium]
MAMGEGLGLRLDPEFRFFEYVGPMLARQWEHQHTLERTVRRIGSALLEAADLGAALPRRMGRLFGRLERGEIEFNVRHEGLEEMTRRFERMTNRLALAVILG